MSTSDVLRRAFATVATAIGLFAVIVSGAVASPVYECIPATAGGAVLAGNSSGECAPGPTVYTSVALPAGAEEQHTLLAILPYLKFTASGVGGKPTIEISGANLQIVNGAGETASKNGAGNLVIGYDEAPQTQRGSHDLILGGGQGFTSYGSILGGSGNTASAPFTVAFGEGNEASANYASVLGGSTNKAQGVASAVSGGKENLADGEYSSVAGGQLNEASGSRSSVGAGKANTARAEASSVTGGRFNDAAGPFASVTGGREGLAGGSYSAVSGGFKNNSEASFSSIFGGKELTATSEYEAIP
jgi:hypothetical protein